MKQNLRTKYIFVSGGVMSSLGKGITSASISLLLQNMGYEVCPVKCENNLNVDFGTLNPIEHGDPFLCHDGLEADLDLGNYERFLGKELGKVNFMTMGQLYKSVIDCERSMGYDGEDVEPIPHITNEIIARFHHAAEETKADFVVVELGGTVGEYQNNNALYYEASRLMAMQEQVLHIHVTYVPVPPHIKEPKTKPAQLGLRDLMSMGIPADMVIVRSQTPIDKQRRYKFSMKFGLDAEDVYSNENLETIYEVPLHLNKQGITNRILRKFNLEDKKQAKLEDWKKLVNKIKQPKANKVKLAIVGKYFGSGDAQLLDAYYALLEAVNHASWQKGVEVEYNFINSDKQENEIEEQLATADAIIVPIGWGTRGILGKLKAIKHARENKIPYLGLCYGMQLAAVEYARNVIGLTNANTTEIDPETKDPVVHNIPFDAKYQTIKGEGTSMRLGTFTSVLKPESLAAHLYQKYGEVNNDLKVEERHRHRFEFNNAYRKQLEAAGMIISATSPDNFFVEMLELPQDEHPYFIATQGHPEYKSTPLYPHPLFLGLFDAALEYQSQQ